MSRNSAHREAAATILAELATALPAGEIAAARTRGLERFLEALVASSDAEALLKLPAGPLARLSYSAFTAIAARARGAPRIETGASPLAPGGAVLTIVNDDMPFLLDSVLAEVHARGLAPTLVLHPIYKAERDAGGALASVSGPGDADWGDGRQESCISVHMGPLSAPRLEELAAAIASILADVRRVVCDWRPMQARVSRAIVELRGSAAPVEPALLAEELAFLSWLTDGNFTFLGLREYRLEGDPETGELASDPGAGLGLLADPEMQVLRRGTELVVMTPEIRQFFFGPDALIITKANVVSRVHRRVHMDYVGIKRFGPGGAVAGELRIVGLFTATAYTQSPWSIPVLRRKVALAADELGLAPGSHAAKSLVNVLETFPRDELFQISAGELARFAAAILDLELRPRVRVLLRYDRFDRFVSALLYLPRDRYATSLRVRIGEHLAERFGGYIAAFYPHFREGPLVRVHFIVARRTGRMPAIPELELEAAITRLLRTWSDDLQAALASQGPEAPALQSRWTAAFPAGYAEVFAPERALEDIARIERLGPDREVGIDVYRQPGLAPGQLRAAIYALDGPIPLSERVPLLENLGLTVIDERTFRLSPRADGRPRDVVLHDMLLETFDGRPADLGSGLDLRLEDTYLAIRRGEAESDSFNRLLLVAGLDWREAALMRALAACLRQLGSAFGPRYIADALAANPVITRALVELFHLRFDPDRGLDAAARRAATLAAVARIEQALAEVSSLDADRILRLFLSLIEAIVRTSFYRPAGDGAPGGLIAFKMDGARLAMAPQPRPYREIFLAHPRVEGVHMRFAPVARGGIRWSDRAQDYRTEILGLAKAQQVKNAVIVPAGAKGGFLPKRLPRTGGREAVQAEGLAAYRVFIGALLDLTDNIVDGALVPPARVVRHDGDDPYLVVAADKGTATFSDTANAIAIERGFWLGDAFASGGSAGYDHKALGITARGAWECVKRHFRELDRNIDVEPFRVIGVGDMSGDVFGNGMLLSPATRLLAAFDHRDIFLDPDPDPAASLAERRRLFATPRSSWADYDRALISRGGGVFSREAKSVPLSPEVKAMLAVSVDALAPADLMRAILAAEADLLWLGGIGTYVRATAEPDAEAGDRANDSIRVTARDLRVKVVGEGANLGLTQRARIEAAERGIRLNSDFIDNSAGVNTSDQEVNIKIALAPAVRAGRLALAERNQLLVAMRDDVAATVLRNNYQQSLALSLAERRGPHDLGRIARLLRELEARGQLDRRLEALPDDREIAERARAGRGLTRPELAVVLSHAKIALLHDLLASPIPDDPSLAGFLLDYFPPPLRGRFADDIRGHRLRREIVATTLTNGLVNRLGPAGPLALADVAGRPVPEVAFAFVAARAMLGLAELWQRIDHLDALLPGAVQLGLYERARHGLVVATAALLRDGVASRPLADTLARLEAAGAGLRSGLAAAAPPALAARLAATAADLAARAVPADLAHDVAQLAVLVDLPAIAGIATGTSAGIAAAARAWLSLGEALHVGELVARAQELAPADDYEHLAIGGGVASLLEAQRRLVASAMTAGAVGEDGIARWLGRAGTLSERALADLDAIAASRDMSVARLAVAAARLSGLAQALEKP